MTNSRKGWGYNGNPNLPKRNFEHSFTQHEVDELWKCKNDPVYFAENYIKIINVDEGLSPFNMWDFQKDMIKTFHNNRFSICLCPRQVGKTTTTVAYILHYILFNKEVRVAILANKLPTAREIMSRLQLAFEYLPDFLKKGVTKWNESTASFVNKSFAKADSTSGSSIRGQTYNIIFLDEFAHVPENLAEKFFNSTYPVISSGKKTKVIIVSTPNGLNMFYKLWDKAVKKKNKYVPISVHWSQVPGRDQAWKEETIANTSEEQFAQEFECEFVGSTNTLISPTKLRSLVEHAPLRKDMGDCLYIYNEPQPKRTYVAMVDVSEGLNLDYSAVQVIDVTDFPYRHVARYRNNKISPFVLPAAILQIARMYNDAHVLVEINSIGLQVADSLHFEMAYDNLIKIEVKGKQGQQNTPGFKKKIAFGLKQSKQTKNIGCANLKAMIENDKLITNDLVTINELKTFSEDKGVFAAEEGKNDDCVMGLVNFGWLTSQRYFKENINNDIREALQKEQMDVMDADIVPFGAIDNGLDDPFADPFKESGEKWMVDRQYRNIFDDLDWDTLTNKHRL